MLYSGVDYLTLPRGDTHWVVPGILPTGGAINIYGAPKSKKSFAALQLAEAVSNPTRDRWLGFPIAAHGPTLYLQFDTPPIFWDERLRAMMGGTKHFNFSGAFFGDRTTLPFPFDIHGEGGQALRADLDRLPSPPLLTVIDTVREIHAGDENDSTVMRNVVAGLTTTLGNSAMVLVSHSRKPVSEFRSLMTENRGSNYIAGRMDTILALDFPGDQKTGKLSYQGRATEFQAVTVLFDEASHSLEVSDRVYTEAFAVIADLPHQTTSAQARELVARLGTNKKGQPLKDFHQARYLLRLLKGQLGHTHGDE